MAWKYEGIFENELNMGADDLSRYWRTEGTEVPIGRMGYRRRITLAGPRMECEIYPVWGKSDTQKARAAKQNQTKEKQRRLNEKRAVRHLIQLADANFSEKDIHLTLTYREAPTWEQTRKDVRNFLLKVKRYREKKGLDELKYIYTMEGKWDRSGGAGKHRIHIHMLMNGGVTREDLEAMWEKGYANADRLQPDERGLEAVARYIVKERELNDRGKRWSASRNLKQPKVRSVDAQTSRGKVKILARSIQSEARDEMEKLYPSYRFVECKVYYSDQVDGVYIRVLMRRKR